MQSECKESTKSNSVINGQNSSVRNASRTIQKQRHQKNRYDLKDHCYQEHVNEKDVELKLEQQGKELLYLRKVRE